jgi:LPS export ABC transporter protein LptC
MDDSGRPRHRLQAPLMRHYADDDSAELQQPQLLLYRTIVTDTGGATEERWQLHAEMAQLYHGGAELLLQGRVQMRRLDAAGKVTLTLETRDLWVYTDQKRAESAEEVEIREDRGVTRARGVKIDLKEGRLELLAAVRGEYVLEQ